MYVCVCAQVESVAARRGYHSSTEQTFDRILSTLLVEMDGVRQKNFNLELLKILKLTST